ncbi:hypothetical protein HMPREF1536_02708 [Parabacteroides gordonii MS-1 = DSM 23371]|uniref:Uncharacterized protein n=1 Tax=Parabacteroides gordonii MS-1 = DSM 23371 TaxID=1203610 RepID=A0A0F5JBZ9_9BACT|nr:hypothetical protein HMPREF1536_02708 [Parabacteroides gordonii MS-1 = DSM 23371]
MSYNEPPEKFGSDTVVTVYYFVPCIDDCSGVRQYKSWIYFDGFD